MALIKTIKGLAPKWGRDCYFSENATIVGEVTMGDECSIWFNAVVRGDVAPITIGDRTLIGPNCQLVTPNHPIDYMERRKPVETGFPITIGEDCWLGAGVIVCPGVTIGNRCVIGAGSVVVKDIPDDSMAVGNPARVIRKLR